MSKATKNAAKTIKATSKSQAKAKTIKAVKASPKAVKPQNGSQLNPYRVGGGYWAAVEALRTLGLGKVHTFAVILPAIKKVYGNDWKTFNAKKGKLSGDERAMVNLAVIARKDYGKPLVEAGFECRYDGREKTAGLFKI